MQIAPSGGGDRGGQALGGGVLDVTVTDLGDRRGVAAAHAGRPQHPHVASKPVRKLGEQGLGAGHGAAQAVADPDGDLRRRRLAVEHDIEMGVEGGDLVDLGHGQRHLLGERVQVRGGEPAIAVLDQVQVLDQQVAVARALVQERSDFFACDGFELPSLGEVGGLAPARAGVNFSPGRCRRRAIAVSHDPR